MKGINMYQKTLNRISDRNWLIIRFVVFPLMALAPFLLSPQSPPFCVPLHPVGNGWYQQGGGYPSHSPIYGILTFAILVAFSFVSLRNNKLRPHVQRRRFILRQIAVSFTAIIVTVPAYIVMRNHSQDTANNSFGFDSSCHMFGQWHHTTFGFGLPWQFLVILSLLYVLIPLTAHRRWFLSRKHIGDVKKKELFQ